MQQTKVKDVMTPNPVLISPDSSLREAAQKMEAVGCGVLPVGSDNQPEGIITDRDIVIRAVARGKDVSSEKVRDYMTSDVCFCEEGHTLEEAAELMNRNQVNRLMVKGEAGDMSGILTFGCILRKDADREEVSNIVECALGRKAA